MTRQLSVEYPGAIYHVMSQGDPPSPRLRRDRPGGEDVFLDDVGRQDFIKAQAEACQKTGWQDQSWR